MSRTPDDGRNERQRQRNDERRERPFDDGGQTARQRLEEEKQDPAFLERMQEERKRPDFIETTRPEDPSDRFGQLTRDNVNPDIPSAPPGEGDIVDPNTLGMPQGGVAPNETPPPPEQPLADEGPPSLNEPPGSEVQPPPDAVAQDAPGAEPPVRRGREGEGLADAPAPHPAPAEDEDEEREALPSDAELVAMTRADLDELAEERGLDPEKAGTKAEVIAMLKRDARKRR